jgi:hypothetical protein
MKKLIVIFIFFLGKHSVNSQIVSSSCSAPNSIKVLYSKDADRLALRKFYAQNLVDTNNIFISQIHSDTVLRALIAVFNATALPARNAVILQYNIHTFLNPNMNTLYVAADSNLLWMQQLKAGNIPTGNMQVDNLISTYSLNKQNYNKFFGLFSYHVATFASGTNCNLPPLTVLFESITGVSFSEPASFVGDGNDISASIYANYIELTYSHGWGDCPAGCIYRHYWKFKVYYNCSVEFKGEYGTPLPSSPPTIFVSDSICTNKTLTVTISGANSSSLNNQPIFTPQFTLSSPTPTTYIIIASNNTYSTSQSISIVDCSTLAAFINENKLHTNISIYPNPVNEILNVESEVFNGKIEIKIVNVLGNLVMKEEFKIKTDATQINVSTLPRGIYYIKVGNEVGKFVKE